MTTISTSTNVDEWVELAARQLGIARSRYEVRYTGAPHARGAYHVRSTHATAGEAWSAYDQLGPAGRREHVPVAVDADGAERRIELNPVTGDVDLVVED